MRLAITVCMWGALVLGMTGAAPGAEGTVYELRVYTCEPGKLEALNARFREHTLRLFEKHGMKNVAYWVPTEGEGAGLKLYYILEHQSREQAQASWEAFRADPEWQQVAAQSQQAHGRILAKPPEATYLTATDYSPAVAPVDVDGAYELRIYVSHPGKLTALNARFREHTLKLFEKHGMQNVAYWTPLDAPGSETTLIYIVRHQSRDAARESWRAFGGDPDWQAARTASERDGPLLAERPQAIFLQTTDYSPRPAPQPAGTH